MVKNAKTWMSWEENSFSTNKKILNLCLRWKILRNYPFVAEVTFKCHTQRMERINWFSRCRTLCWVFWKKNHWNKIFQKLVPKNSCCGRQQPYNLNTGEPVPATISIALFWWSERFIYFLFILIQFCYW